MESFKQKELTCCDFCCIKVSLAAVQRIDYGVGLMPGSNHALLRLSRQVVMEAGHREMMEEVWAGVEAGIYSGVQWTGCTEQQRERKQHDLWAWGLGKRADCGAFTDMENAWVESMTQAAFSLWGGDWKWDQGFALSARFVMNRRYLNGSPKCEAGFTRQE